MLDAISQALARYERTLLNPPPPAFPVLSGPSPDAATEKDPTIPLWKTLTTAELDTYIDAEDLLSEELLSRTMLEETWDNEIKVLTTFLCMSRAPSAPDQCARTDGWYTFAVLEIAVSQL
eukprot:gene24631-10590_t